MSDFCSKFAANLERMGQLAFIKTFILVTMPIDANDNGKRPN